ncbi:MAG: uracil-DNA glycosylase [Rhodopila sp.]
MSEAPPALPAPDCPLCPRLVGYRLSNRDANPGWHNGAVPSFGALDARVLVVGLAPGVRGANRTGRPFTGDFAGVLLYQTLLKFGLARGVYGADPADGMVLPDTRVTNAVRCVPPANLPTPAEITTCNQFLIAELAAMPNLRAVLALGGVAHKAVLRARGLRASHVPFQHGALHRLADGLVLADSYHVSRLNTNTGRLTTAMFEQVVSDIVAAIG